LACFGARALESDLLWDRVFVDCHCQWRCLPLEQASFAERPASHAFAGEDLIWDFFVSLFFAGSALLFRLPIFPWDLNADSSIIFGCIFIGDAFYFLYGLIRPRWQNAFGQLLSFLAYDLVLIGPFLALSKTVDSDHLLNLIVYIAVLLYSGVLAVYYLFINPLTRFGI
jgi:hypothetical protein